MIVGTRNAVNLTDGLDGLAIMPAVMIGGALGIFAYVAGNAVFTRSTCCFPYIPGAGELTVFCGAMAGAGLGFLWFNAYPAEVFMGDVGALALGAALGTIAVIVRQEIVLFIMGGVFVVETLSVMLQVGYFKATGGKRIFRMAPLHHHYELEGWKETQVVVRFWIITHDAGAVRPVDAEAAGLRCATLRLAAPEPWTDGKRVWCWGSVTPGSRWRAGSRARAARVRVADTRAAPPALAALRARCRRRCHTGAVHATRCSSGVDLIALSPGVPLRRAGRCSAARARGVPVVGDIELFAQAPSRRARRRSAPQCSRSPAPTARPRSRR